MSIFLKKSLEENNFVVEEIQDSVLLVKDFISEEELATIFNIINDTKEETWFIEYTQNLKRFCLEKFGRDDVDNLVAEGKFEITQGWQDKNLNIANYSIYKIIQQRLNNFVQKENSTLELSGFGTIQRMQEGVELKSHTDQHTDPSIKYAAILYLNDDYVDGELFFKKNKLPIKPQKRSLLIFPGNDEFEHGVRHVGKGPIRYVLVGFIKIKDFYKSNKY
jgi:virulence-associated protein VapD